MKTITTSNGNTAIDVSELAEWVGLHYGRNFDKEAPEKKQEWADRYVEASEASVDHSEAKATAIAPPESALQSEPLVRPAGLTQPRVLVYVSGGVAEVIADPGVEVVVFDEDNYDDAPDESEKVPPHFADLASHVDAPVAAPATDTAEALSTPRPRG